MNGSLAESTDRPVASPARFDFNSDAQALALFDRVHSLILLGGGVGSGKSVLHGLDAILRSKREVDVLHGLFSNTQVQMEKLIIPSIQARFAGAGFETPVYDHRPPLSWVRRWVREGISVPQVARYRGVLTAPTGYHALCGTLSAQSFHQYESVELGTARIEEAINVSLEAIETIFERVRCSTGGGEHCRRNHAHQRYLIWNPPRGPHPWLYSYLDSLEEAARSYYHPIPDGEICTCSHEHGPMLNHRQWPLLQRGVGPAVWYRSKTIDNADHLDEGYIPNLAANMSKDTARRRLDGEVIRETEGRAYGEFSDANIHPLAYDPDRILFLGLDFNSEPRAAVFAHPLNPGEYPTENEREGVAHLGVFGEYFYAGKMSDRNFAQALVRGDRGDGCDSQPRYRDETLRGLPANWQGLKAHRGGIIAYGDQRGTHRSSHGDNLESSWEIVEQVFRELRKYGRDVPGAQPSPRARVDSVNGKFCNAFDVRSLWIDPRCEELVRDLEQVMWDADGNSLREWRRGFLGTEWHRTHLSDGLGYLVHRRSPLGRDVRDASPKDMLESCSGLWGPTKLRAPVMR